MSAPQTSRGFTLESADSVRFGDDFTPEEQERNHKILLGEALGGLLLGERIWSSMPLAFDSLGMARILSAFAESFLKKPGLNFQPFQICSYRGDQDIDWGDFSEVFSNVIVNRLRKPSFILSSLPKLNEKVDPVTGDTVKNDERQKLIEALNGWKGKPLDIGLFEKAGMADDELEHFSRLTVLDEYIRAKCGEQKFAAGERGVPIRLNRSPETPLEDLKTFLLRAIDPRYLPNTDDFSKVDSSEITKITTAIPELVKIHDLSIDKKKSPFADRSKFRAALKGLKLGDNVYRIAIELADAHYTRAQYRSLCHASREITSAASDSEASDIGERWAQNTVPHSTLAEPDESSLLYTSAIIPEQEEGEAQGGGVNLGLVCDRFTEWLENPDLRGTLTKFQELLNEARNGEVNSQRLNDGVGEVTNQANTSFKDVGIHFDYNSINSTLFVHVQGECVKSGGYVSSQPDVDSHEFDGSNNHVPS